MKRYLYILLAAMAVGLSGCGLLGGGSDDPTEQDLIGRWETPSTQGNGKLVFVFTDEECVNAGSEYGKWGYTFDEGDNVTEDDLMNTDADGDYHGNGWFGWTLSGKKIQTYQMHSASDAVDPFTYEIISLSGNSMTMREGNMGTYNLTRVK